MRENADTGRNRFGRSETNRGMDEFAPVAWDRIKRVSDRLFYDRPTVVERHWETDSERAEHTDVWSVIEPLYNRWKHEYKREGESDRGAAYLLAYLIERTGVGSETVADRHRGDEALDRWFRDDRQPL